MAMTWEERLDTLLAAANDHSKALNEAAQSHKKFYASLIRQTELLYSIYTLIAYFLINDPEEIPTPMFNISPDIKENIEKIHEKLLKQQKVTKKKSQPKKKKEKKK